MEQELSDGLSSNFIVRVDRVVSKGLMIWWVVMEFFGREKSGYIG